MARRVVEEGLTLTEAAEAAGVSVRMASKWARRYRAEGEAGLLDRGSAPRAVHNATPAASADRSWLFSTLWDDDWACIGGSRKLADDFLTHPDLRPRIRKVDPAVEDANSPGHTAI